MYEPARIKARGGAAFYDGLCEAMRAGLGAERDWIANLANASALLADQMERVNWVGFYLMRCGELVVGPFQGKPACTRIALGRGVCGTAAARRETVVVPDVHAFPGHIACDGASRSEVVVPMITADGRLVGVLDVDSPELARFDGEDARGLERVVGVILGSSDVG